MPVFWGTMMEIIKSDQLKIKILKELAKAKGDLSYYAVMKRLKMNDSVFFRNCRFLELLELVAVHDIRMPNGRAYHYVSITQQGRDFLERVAKAE